MLLEIGDKVSVLKKVSDVNGIPKEGWMVIKVIRNGDGSFEYVIKNGNIEKQVPQKFIEGRIM